MLMYTKKNNIWLNLNEHSLEKYTYILMWLKYIYTHIHTYMNVHTHTHKHIPKLCVIEANYGKRSTLCFNDNYIITTKV